jgi:flagellar hook-associated protein 2
MVRATGLGSGLDVEGLVTQLIAAEANPQTVRLNRNETAFQAKISAYGALRGALTEFQNALSGLKDLTSLSARKVVMSDDTHFAATAGEEAVPGVYEVEVVSLAEPHRLMSTGVATPATAVGTGTLTITSGAESFAVTVGASNQTLEGIRDAINAATDNDSVDATIITVDNGSGGSESRLILSARETGTANAIQVAVTGDGDANNTDALGLSQLSYTTGAQNLTEQQPAVDAVIEVYGQTVTRSTNSIEDAITGVTLDLKEAEVGATTTVTISLDTGKLKGLDQRLREVVQHPHRQPSEPSRSTTRPPAVRAPCWVTAPCGRSTRACARMIGEAADVDGAFKTLASIGVKVDDKGVLSVDADDLDAALASDFADVATLFGAEETGLGARLDEMLEGYTEGKGIIQARVDGLQAGLKDVADQRVALERRIEGLESRFRAQFNAMDQIVSPTQLHLQLPRRSARQPAGIRAVATDERRVAPDLSRSPLPQRRDPGGRQNRRLRSGVAPAGGAPSDVGGGLLLRRPSRGGAAVARRTRPPASG